MTTFDHWCEWKKRCALTDCGPEAQSALMAFGRERWAKYLSSEGGYGSPEQGELSTKDIWHRFEAWCWTEHIVNGKAYKDWLFKRLATHHGTPLQIVQSGATLLMRDVVREYLRHEGRSRRPGQRKPEPSLDESVPGTDGAVTYGDLLPGELETESLAVLGDYQRLGREGAQAAFGDLSELQRIVLAARGLGLPLSNPEVERIAGRKKSVLSDTVAKLEATIISQVDAKYRTDDEAGRRLLAAITLKELMVLCQEPKNSSETWLTELFRLTEARDLL